MRTIGTAGRFAGVLMGVLAVATSVHATDGVVGPGNCNEAGFESVLASVDGSGGGTITFDCGVATIAFTNYKQIANHVLIDGANAITFDGGGVSAFFQVFASANVTLKRLVLTHGDFAAAHPLENFGALTLEGVTLQNNGPSGSAIANSGTLVASNSIISNNSLGSGSGAALSNDGGDVTLNGTTFTGNSLGGGNAGNGGAIAQITGTLTINGGFFASNRALDGGAIYVDPAAGAVVIDGAIFNANSAGYGAAIETWGPNTQVSRSRLTSNTALSGDGGGIWQVGGQLVIDRSEFEGNTAATTGGGFSCYGDITDVIDSTFANNESGSNGGAIYSACAFSALNVTLNGNTAFTGGGGLYQNSGVDSVLTFATVDGNSAVFGGGLYNEGSSAGVLRVGNSIVSANPGGNCDGVLASNGYNLSDDMHCGAAFTGPGDVLNASLPLEILGNYGGLTSTQPPEAGNPAIDHVPLASCGFPFDQRGGARPFGAACDSGAVELGAIVDLIFADGFDGVSRS